MQNLEIVQDLKEQMSYFNINKQFSNIVILCVGTNKIAGDSIGPMVGQKLIESLKNKEHIVIYGNMRETLNFKNAKQILQQILIKYKKPFIITVDAALGKEEMIEKIVVGKGKVQIGASLGRSACCNSHISIKGIVGKYEEDKKENLKTLMNTDIKMVQKMANEITYGINQVVKMM